MTLTTSFERPLVVTKRMVDYPNDSHTLERYRATGGYEGARKALGMTATSWWSWSGVRSPGPGRCRLLGGDEVEPAGSGPPRLLIVNGDESDPAPSRTGS